MTEHLTPSEVQAVIKAAKVRSTRDWAMVLLAYRHGLRASEVCGLKLSDVDIRNESITLRRLKGSLKTVQPLYRHRGQPLLDEVHAMKAWLRERADDGSDYVFTSQKGGRLDRTQFFRIFQVFWFSVKWRSGVLR
ncbi:MAG: tyrosine-type recombinase/integrase [Candidatus Sulfotelmatobacter sp.]